MQLKNVLDNYSANLFPVDFVPANFDTSGTFRLSFDLSWWALRNYGKKGHEFITRVSVTLAKSQSNSDDDFRSGCRNFSQSHRKQSFSGLHSPGRSYFTELWYDSCVQTIYSTTVILQKPIIFRLIEKTRRKITPKSIPLTA